MVNKKYISGEDVVGMDGSVLYRICSIHHNLGSFLVGMDGSVLYRTEPLVDVGEDVYIKPDGNLYGLERPEDE